MNFYIPYAYDRGPGPGGRARCDEVVHHIIQQAIKTKSAGMIILTAGYSDEERCPEPSVTLAKQMEAYVRGKMNLRGDQCIIQSSPVAWGTLGETEEAIAMIQRLSKDKNITVYISTNLGHIPRVFMCWLILAPQEWKIRFLVAKHSFTTKEYLQEFVKFWYYFRILVLKKPAIR